MSDNILLITSSGGGGLLQSAIAIEQEEKLINPQVNIYKKDLLMEWTGPMIGKFGRFFYNWTHRSGNVFFTNCFVNLNMYANRLFYPTVFFSALYNLFKHDIDKVIDNQPMNASAVIKAIRLYNFCTKKNVIMEKVFVDLPTREYRQLMKSVKNLSKNDKKLLKIVTIEPLLDGEQSNEKYWQKHCRISESQVEYKKFVIRQSFKKYQSVPLSDKEMEITIKFSSIEEKDFIKRCFVKGPIKVKEIGGVFIFTINPKDKLFTILLGTQPSSKAVYQYVKAFIDRINESNNKKQNYYLFVFADRFLQTKETMFHKIFQLTNSLENYPKNLSIVPMSFQSDEVIAPLFHRSNLTITRSGGHTIMELMAVSNGVNWIHSETKKQNAKEIPSYKQLLKGIPAWEAGNARYLHDFYRGDIICPDIIYQKLGIYI